MTIEPLKAYVSKADGKNIHVKSMEKLIEKKLIDIGFSFDSTSSEYLIGTQNNSDKAKVFNELRNLDISFSGGKEWSPAEVFEYLRDLGLISGSFKRVSWRGPDDYYFSID